jgi:hypothetical protein
MTQKISKFNFYQRTFFFGFFFLKCFIFELESYILKLQCLYVRLCRHCLEDFSSHCPFPVKCFGGWGKGKPGEARGWGGQHGRGRGTGGKGPGRGNGQERIGRAGGMGGEGPGGGGGGARAGKDRAGGSSTGALCTGFTLVFKKMII